MEVQKPVRFETKHIRCSEGKTQFVINQHQIFFWELINTQTVVAKESHLERKDDFLLDSYSIYSVTTEERFTEINFRRNKDIPNYSDIKAVEAQYFLIVAKLENLGSSIADNYATPPPKPSPHGCIPSLFEMIFKTEEKKYKKAYEEWKIQKRNFDSLLDKNKQILNL